MRKLTFYIFFLISSNLSNSQWVQIATIGNYDLRGVKFFNEHTGIVVGSGGIWRSTNSGVNWTQILAGENLNGLSFPDANTGYAVGDSGKIYKTINGGLNWEQQGIGVTTKKLNSVSFPNNIWGWAVGEDGLILHTYNAGSNFVVQNSGVGYNINYIQMIDDHTGYICGSVNEEIFGFTVNIGINWLWTFYMGGNILNALSYIPVSGGAVLAVGSNGRIRKTTNNGINWVVATSPVNVSLNNVVFLDGSTGYIAGNSGYILKTTNSGLNWTVDANVTTSNFKNLSFINQTTAWVVGTGGVVIRTGIPVGISNSENEMPQDFELKNYPNPFNPTTIISFSLHENSFVRLIIYDVIGNEIQTLVSGELKKGYYEILFDGSSLASGLYYCRIETRSFKKTIKMVLTK
ncbi:MAG: YCF48-related protein [Chlorobi bacterium]|nr:YCF48-related protein [Chlorobiota bacterium]MCI0716937.1 YCF48-related protein [Chlorobiota bacterium]